MSSDAREAVIKPGLGPALRDLSWFSWAFAVLVGGPSTLVILQEVVVSHQLTPLLQRVVDGYSDLIGVVGAAFEPLIAPIVAWANTTFSLDLTLQPHWRPLFALSMVFGIGMARNLWREGYRVFALISGVLLWAGALVGALIAGVAPLDGGPLSQGVSASAPVAMIFFALGLGGLLEHIGMGRPVAGLLALGQFFGMAVVFGGLAFGAGAALTLVPTMLHGAGVIAFGGGLFATALAMVAQARTTGDPLITRLGLTILGGFLAAGLILAADAGLKAMA